MSDSISVIIPAWNAEKYLEECINSIYNQTKKPDEIILVDDGSTDNTSKIATDLGVEKIIESKENLGIGFARKYGAENATKNFISFLSADDVWKEDFLEKTSKNWTDFNIVYTNYFQCYDNLKDFNIFRSPEPSMKNILEWAERIDMFINFSSLFMQKSIFHHVNQYSRFEVGEDLVFVLESILAGCKFKLVEEPLLYYRFHKGQEDKFKNRKKQVNDERYKKNIDTLINLIKKYKKEELEQKAII